MVHALERARGRLAPHGCIIDIHPTSDPARLVIETVQGRVIAGELEDMDNGCGPGGRHAQADAAVRQAVSEGWLVLEGRRDVTFLHEADSLAGMLAHVQVEWRNARFTPVVLERARALVRGEARARVLLEEDITLWRLRPSIQRSDQRRAAGMPSATSTDHSRSDDSISK